MSLELLMTAENHRFSLEEYEKIELFILALPNFSKRISFSEFWLSAKSPKHNWGYDVRLLFSNGGISIDLLDATSECRSIDLKQLFAFCSSIAPVSVMDDDGEVFPL